MLGVPALRVTVAGGHGVGGGCVGGWQARCSAPVRSAMHSRWYPATHPFFFALRPAGMSYSFFTSANGRMARQLVQVLEEAGQVVPPELRQFATTSGGPSSE